MSGQVWLTICAVIVVIMAPTFYLGRLWERDSYPRGDHHEGGPKPFAPPRPDLAERAQTERVQAKFDRLMGGFGVPVNPDNPLPRRAGGTVNQWWEQVMEQRDKETQAGTLTQVKPLSGGDRAE